MRVITSMVQPGGWHFIQPLESGQHQRIDGRTYDELVERVFQFRLQHIELVPSGTATKERVEGDLLHWICTRWPRQCSGSTGELPPSPASERRIGYQRPANRVEDWFKLLATKNLEWVDQATAYKRAKICAACKLNQQWQTNCGPCNTNIRTKALLLRGSHKLGLEGNLRACLSFGWLNEISVWLVDGFNQPTRALPPACWKN
ncbi:MAG TPA: hypothetical protein VHS80_13955 [Chthoniobacterales bacterium]|nr:hypothetical protein [Chthoniobacterales bacterium]